MQLFDGMELNSLLRPYLLISDCNRNYFVRLKVECRIGLCLLLTRFNVMLVHCRLLMNVLQRCCVAVIQCCCCNDCNDAGV